MLVFVVICCLLPAKATPRPDEISVTISNIPQGTKSLFIPLSRSTKLLDLYSADIKDSFFHGYLTRVEFDDDDNLLGLSIISLNKGDLPYSVEAVLKYGKGRLADPEAEKEAEKEEEQPREISLSESTNLEDLANVSSDDLRPLINNSPVPVKRAGLARLVWDSPWAYSQVTHKIEGGAAGFLELKIDSSEKAKKVKPKLPSNSQKDKFYISTFGQTITQSKTTEATEDYQAPFQLDRPALKSMRFFVFSPTGKDYQTLYIPLRLDNPEALCLKTGDQIFNPGYTMRLTAENIVEFRGIEQKALPAGQVLSADLTLSQNHLIPENGILVGPVLSEPAKVISGINVSISPSIVQLDKFFNPKDFFLLK
ncbi:MAG: hypothetical protein SFT81_01350 [Candidatus Caenarcaniphilales bacterium]|nr:hypothetical protein [Candidatus Caenarcaniphilales bacterium]